ncbi:uncharacterized protein DS421_3g100490 [Arachis hypogaea]|nr:uncharacterized protein DS421_3g100490 [Arachis hypogaea]
MAQEQPSREQLLQNAPTIGDQREQQADVRKSEDRDRGREELGTRAAGAPDPGPTSESDPYDVTDYGTIMFDNSACAAFGGTETGARNRNPSVRDLD